MKNIIYLSLLIVGTVVGQNSVKTKITQEFKDYWYTGKGEISSYILEQERYGELHVGHAVNIFVTEPFSRKHNTKADSNDATNVSVLKLNATKKFTTGVYPYSIMTSTFVPVNYPDASLKISSSTQEWCGHEYLEVKNKSDYFEMRNFSYFEGKSFENKKIEIDVVLEDDLWSKIRLSPENLPKGTFNLLPSLVYLRFSHKSIKPYKAIASVSRSSKLSIYKISYPELNRVLEISFENNFPHKILNWQETYESGWGNAKKILTTKATLLKTLNIPYWEKNKNSNANLRNELGLNY